MSIASFQAQWAPRLLSILRITAALLFVEHGTSKVLGVPPSPMPWHFDPSTLMGWAGVIELVGGLLLLVGLFTHLTAFILSGEMAVAYFTVHAHNNFFPMINKGEIAALYCFVFLYLSFAGGGPWSIDHLRKR